MTKKTVLAVVDEVGEDLKTKNSDYRNGWEDAIACVYNELEMLPYDDDDPEDLRRIIIALCMDLYVSTKP